MLAADAGRSIALRWYARGMLHCRMRAATVCTHRPNGIDAPRIHHRPLARMHTQPRPNEYRHTFAGARTQQQVDNCKHSRHATIKNTQTAHAYAEHMHMRKQHIHHVESVDRVAGGPISQMCAVNPQLQLLCAPAMSPSPPRLTSSFTTHMVAPPLARPPQSGTTECHHRVPRASCLPATFAAGPLSLMAARQSQHQAEYRGAFRRWYLKLSADSHRMLPCKACVLSALAFRSHRVASQRQDQHLLAGAQHCCLVYATSRQVLFQVPTICILAPAYCRCDRES